MKISGAPGLSLSYCMNIHPGESADDLLRAIRGDAHAIAELAAPGSGMGIGLRISDAASRELDHSEKLNELRDALLENRLAPLGINGFPFGTFHGTRVKEQVYAPDWRDPARKAYTLRLARILAQLAPDGFDAGISTVPVSWKPWIHHPEEINAASRMLSETALELSRLEESSGRCIHLGLEPEPSCVLETTAETLSFFHEGLFRHGRDYLATLAGITQNRAEQLLRRHLGVCLDTCHAAVMFESPLGFFQALEKSGIRISRVQVSTALALKNPIRNFQALEVFREPVYLHQVCACRPDGTLAHWQDLAQAMETWAAHPEYFDEARIHFHAPLHWCPADDLHSTAKCLTPDFFTAIRNHPNPLFVETETYTFTILPDLISRASLPACVAAELAWCRERLFMGS